MKKPISLTDSYLRDLAKNLESLGPAETREVVAEVQSHILDAQLETGNERAALDRLGDSTQLATQILRERGVIVEDTTIPVAPRWRRGLALTIDISVSLLGLYLGLFFFLLSPMLPMGASTWWAIPLAFLQLLACLAVLIWLPLRWIRERRRGAGTIGMRVMLIRRVRIGQEKRVVRSSDIPGLMPTKAGRVAWGLRTAWSLVVLVLLAGAIWGIVENTTHQDDGMRDVDMALRDGVEYAVGATATVERLYSCVMSGASPDELASLLSPDASAIGMQLIARSAAGRIASHEIWSAELIEYTWPQPTLDTTGQTYRLRMKVVVGEYPQGSEEMPVAHEYVLTYTEICDWAEYDGDGNGGSAWTSSWAVTSMRLHDEQLADGPMVGK